MKKLVYYICVIVMILSCTLLTGCDRKYSITYIDAVNMPRAEYTKKDGEISLPRPHKKGYKFLGWTIDGENELVLDFTFDAREMAKSLIFTAHWEKKEAYTVRLNLDYTVPCYYGKNQATYVEDIVVAYDYRIIDLNIAVPLDKESYDFKHWEFIKEDGTPLVVTSKTLFNEENFGTNTFLIINAVCVSNYTDPI